MTNLKVWYLTKNISLNDNPDLVYEAGPFPFSQDAEKYKNNTIAAHSRNNYIVVSNTILVSL